MPTIKLTLPTLHASQSRIKSEAARFNAVACGRRFGKTTLGKDLVIAPLLRGHPVGWFSPTYKMLSDVWREMADVLLPVTKRANAQEHRIELVTGGVFDMWSLDAADSARGRKYARVVIDEAAMVPGLADAWQAVIRPTLTDLSGDGWLLSTPRGINFFHACFERGKDGGDWRSWQMPTSANPHIPAAEIEAARAELPDRIYRQEYLAEFIADAGGVFRNVQAAASILEPDLPTAHAGHSIMLGVDWAKQNDYTVVTAGCRECKRIVDWDRYNRVDYVLQRARLVDMAGRWRPQTILAESNSIGEPNIEMLQREGLPVRGFETTAATKPPLIESLALAIERGEIAIPAEYAGELQAYEMARNEHTGRPRYGAPQGQHDDRVMSLALCWRAMESVPISLGIM